MNIALLIAHPDLESSKANRILSEEAAKISGISVRNLYAECPGGIPNLEKEREWLLASDRIILQFPFYWYSSPALLKTWIDEVLSPEWMLGKGNPGPLFGKEATVAVTAGGTDASYRSGALNPYTPSELLRPFQLTFQRGGAAWLPPYLLHDADRMTEEDLRKAAKDYAAYLTSASSVMAR